MNSRKFDITEAYIQALQEETNKPNRLYGEWIDLVDMIPSDDLDDYVVEYDITDAEFNGSAKPSDERLKELIDGANYILHNKVFGESKKLNEEFTVDTFNNKYKPLYNNGVEVDGDKVSVDNITLRGSGMSKKVGATLKGNNLQIDNEFIGISYDGNNISVNGQYWFTSDFEDNAEFNAKVTKAVKDLYNDMKKLQQPAEEKPEEPKTVPIHNEVDLDEVIAMFREMVADNPNNEKAKNFLRKYDKEFKESKELDDKKAKKIESIKNKLNERKKYWDPVYREYEQDGHKFLFKCIYYEVSGSSQASLWGHEVYLMIDGNQISYNKTPYYNRTWESFEFQTCMLGALGKYEDEVEKGIYTTAREKNGVKGIKKDQKEELLANNEWYQTLQKVYDTIAHGDRGTDRTTENKKLESKALYESNDDEFYDIETEIDTDSVERNENIISGSGTINYYKTQEDLDNKEPSSTETFTFEYDVDDSNDTLYIYDTGYAGDVDEEKIKDYIKNEVIPNTDDGSTVSLLAVAYRDIPEVGVEDWGKDNELYFCLDTKKLLSYLEDYEVEIPKYLVDNEDEPVDTYLSDYLGINPDDGEFDNSYNWGSRLTHDLEIATYTSKKDDTFYVKISVHREGDVRGNYTTDFLLRFDDNENFYETMLDAQSYCANTFEFEGKKFWVEPHIFDEHVDISVEGEDDDWTDVYCEDLDQLKEIISENSEE